MPQQYSITLTIVRVCSDPSYKSEVWSDESQVLMCAHSVSRAVVLTCLLLDPSVQVLMCADPQL